MEKKSEIKEIAAYCLNCKSKNCQKACPLGNNIPAAIEFIKDEKWKEAYEVFSQTTALSVICGNVCPHEKQCEGACIRGIKGEPVQIGKIEEFLRNAGCFRRNKYKN